VREREFFLTLFLTFSPYHLETVQWPRTGRLENEKAAGKIQRL